ncbi:PucR family transcriptional regulator [Nocardia panacis]|uniref:PucR family transcriptional regulator n=1 Tax=Nocardia panacis TaxID=2340916 RepID=A0A3A4JW72_9NOCA|nr:helix-turn-helix domain-containing protein [Nocardia panacis]RJO70892.1 PucR family transcriptional regulator [Nocardia panacis]
MASANLVRILDDLGEALLRLLGGDAENARQITGVAIHDPLDEQPPPAGSLVLGIGLRDSEQIRRLLGDLGGQGAAALVVRSPLVADPALVQSAQRSGVALLELTRGASWTQLTTWLRGLLADDRLGEPETLGGIPSGDLFALANAVAALLDAPVTIEDRNSRVLAFSGGQDAADVSRTETILGRQVPAQYSQYLAEQGVFRELARSDSPVRIAPQPGFNGFTVARIAQAVRAGDELLGSIWAATDEPLTPARIRSFEEVGKLAAVHLLRQRAGSDVARRLRADLVGRALDAGPDAVDALRKLGVADQPVTVLAMVPDRGDHSPAADARRVSEHERLADAFGMHLNAVYPAAATALLGDTTYGIVPVFGAPHRAVETARDFLARIGERAPVRIGIGTTAVDVAGLRRSREDADRALRVLAAGTRRVAHISEVQTEALLQELHDLMTIRRDPLTGPIARLRDYDTAQGSCLVATLDAWLTAFGDVNAAAAAVYIHPNTFRYRLRRITEVGGIDLTDSDSRFGAMLQLKLLAMGNPG